MTSIVTGFVGLVGSVVKYTFWTSIGVVGVAGIALYVTKPDTDSFDKYLKTYVKKNTSPFVSLVSGPAVDLLTTTNVKDYVLVKVAEVTIAGQKDTKYYLGVAQNWISL